MTLEERTAEAIVEAGAADDQLRWSDCLATIAETDGEQIANDYGLEDDLIVSRLDELLCRAYNQQIDWGEVSSEIDRGYKSYMETLDAMFN